MHHGGNTRRSHPPSSSSILNRSTPPVVAHPWCDICWATPSWKGLSFQRCVTCQVGVHEECYGISGYDDDHRSTTDPHPNFQCWACQAVGTTVKVRERDAGSKHRLRFKVTERPTECCLCSVDDGKDWYHAMHPIYDRHGIYGRQMVLPPTKDHPQPRLAWGHTLCCFVLYTHVRTAGCVYACDARGAFDGTNDDPTSLDDDDDDDASTTSSANSVLVDTQGPNDVSIHHFGYCLPARDNNTDDAWTKVIREHQQELKCYLCGKTDKFASSFRIPIQCSANDPDEFEGLKGCHNSDRPCLVAMHVGCARWWGYRRVFGERPSVRKVWFFPGKGDDDGNILVAPVSNLFCQAHAEENSQSGVPGALTVRCPDDMPIPTFSPPPPPPPPPADPSSSSTSGVAANNWTSINYTPDRDVQTATTIVGTKGQNQVATIQAFAERASSATANSAAGAHKKQTATSKTAAGVSGGASAASITVVGVRRPKKKRWTCQSHGPGRAADVRSQPGLRESGEAYNSVAAVGTKRKVGSSASVLLPPERLSPPPQTFVTNERKDSIRDKLIRKAYKGIREDEESGKYHLDDILAISAARWKEKLEFPPTEFHDFWELVVAMVSKTLDYSTEKSDWSFLTADDNSDLKRQYARSWDTVKLLHLGHVPDDLNDT